MDIYNQILQLLEENFHLLGGQANISEEKRNQLKEASNILEMYWNEWDFETIEMFAGRGSKTLHIRLTSADLIAENGRNNHLFRLVTLADSVRFSGNDTDSLHMELQFNDVIDNESAPKE